jgi:ABC-2 type transport system ATP-binding protein
MKPTEGSIEIKGNIVPMLELGSGFDMELSGRENIFLNGAILGYTEKFLKRKYNEIVEFSELGGFIEAPIRTYSSGMLARLAFSVACVVEPEILIVDEILSVGDADFQEKSRKRMMELMTGGTTVFFVSHSIKQIKEMCNKVLWLEHGKVIMYDETARTCGCYENKLLGDNKK